MLTPEELINYKAKIYAYLENANDIKIYSVKVSSQK